jgi:phosphoribosylformimino-5-aminoimidazole carboxamide ribotide isomerase
MTSDKYMGESMDILPAIDLKDGKAVRLTKGLMDSAKIYSDEPYELAKRFEELGSKWLHIVDLNGAFAGEPKNLAQIEKIRANCNLKIELGGGIRDEETIKKYIELGIDRIILGSIAVKNPQFVKEMAKKYPIAVGIDAKDGMVAVEGWAEVSSMKAVDLAREFANAGVEAIICTDISKDGTLSGVNVDFTKEIAISSKINTIASGGVKDINDIIALKACGEVAGVIVGKAFYERTINLEEAFKII